jgi:hypothetical protein
MRIRSLVFILTVSTVMLSQAPQPAPPYMNPDLSPEVRAKDLVSRMTLEQKVRQMQNAAPAIPELNVAQYEWWNEGLHGVARAGQATVFPQAIGLAATVGHRPDVSRGRCDFHGGALRNTTRQSVRTITVDITGSHSGRRTSTSFGIRDGEEGRRPTEKIRF